MDKLLSKFASIVENRCPWLTQWKKDTGRRVMGCCPMYVPEEIIHAAGILPVTLLGSDEEITAADQYTQLSICRLIAWVSEGGPSEILTAMDIL